MKNFYSLLILCCFFLNCSNNDEATMTTPSTTLLASKPEANSMFDNSYKGIYKGIVIGDISGALYVDILNDDKLWAMFQTENNEKYILQNVPFLEGEGLSSAPALKRYTFANENVSFEVKFDENGNNIETSNFKFYSDNSSKICLAKEKSTSLIKCYTGMFRSDSEGGNVNFISDGRLHVKGLSKDLNTESTTNVIGEIDLIFQTDELTKSADNQYPITQFKINANLHNGHIKGSLIGYKFDGKWMNEENEIGDWNATRIL